MQSYTDFEVLIVDGGSTDDTLKIIAGYDDSRIKIVSEKDEGLYYALNKGISRSIGDVVGFLHSDDFFPDSFVLGDLANVFDKEEQDNNKIAGLYGDLKYVNAEDSAKVVRNWVSKPFERGNLKYGWMPPHPTLFLGKSVFNDLGGFDTEYRIAADYDFILKLCCSNKYELFYFNRVITHMRVGGMSNNNLKSVIKKSLEDFRIINNYPLLGVLTLLSKNIRKLSQFI
jgi:glycosyltransferase